MPPTAHPTVLRTGVGASPDRPLRIAMVTARYLPETGGTEVHTHEVAERLVRRGAEVVVIATTSQRTISDPSTDSPFRVMKVHAWTKRLDLYFAPGLMRELKAAKPDIVHCQGFHTLVAPIAMLAARRMKTQYVVTLHSGGHSSRLRTIFRPLQAWLLRPLLLNAHALVAGSSFEARQFARWLRLPVDRFVVLPSGVDLPHPSDVGRRACCDELVLSVGRLESYKRHQIVLRALRDLHRQRPNIRLQIVGSGRYERQLRRLARRLGVEHLVEISSVPVNRREMMARLLRQADVVVSLSSYESQGIAMQEALALGCRLVVSDAGALAELRQYANVRVVSPRPRATEVASAIVEMLSTTPVAPPEMPTWEACVSGLVDLYEDALKVSG